MKNIATPIACALVGFVVGLVAGCANTGIKHVDAKEFMHQARMMEQINSASGTCYIGTTPTRAYLERTGLYTLFPYHKAIVYWTEVENLPPETRDQLKHGKLPWTPWQENTTIEDNRLPEVPSSSAGLTAALGAHAKPEWIQLTPDGRQFVGSASGSRFTVWGFNYDHDDAGRLIEDYWDNEWVTVVEDFHEMKDLGANTVRVHLQLARFMEAADTPNPAALKQLGRLVALAEQTGLYLDITGLGCYHKHEVPAWYDELNEAQRWGVQALFWEAVAKTCAKSHAVFCYDLMNEPILPGEKTKAGEWLAGEFGGKHFVQRITLDLAGRTKEQVAHAWVNGLVTAIRTYDHRHLITVGVIPWAHTFPNAKPLFYSDTVGENLDFVSVHFYPRKGEVHRAVTALKTYDIGKPIVIEETFPLWCGENEFEAFIDATRETVDGYVGFYWGRTIGEYSTPDTDLAGSMMRNWLNYFRMKRPEILEGDH